MWWKIPHSVPISPQCSIFRFVWAVVVHFKHWIPSSSFLFGCLSRKLGVILQLRSKKTYLFFKLVHLLSTDWYNNFADRIQRIIFICQIWFIERKTICYFEFLDEQVSSFLYFTYWKYECFSAFKSVVHTELLLSCYTKPCLINQRSQILIWTNNVKRMMYLLSTSDHEGPKNFALAHCQ